MPYIKPTSRDKFSNVLNEIEEVFEDGVTSGDMNYLITNIVIQYVKTNGLNYSHINDIIGVLECVKAEFQRRYVGGYEDIKILENGDV